MRHPKRISAILQAWYELMLTWLANQPDVHEQYPDGLLALYDQTGTSVVDDSADDVEPTEARR